MKNIAIIFSLLFVALLFFPLANLLGLTDQNDPILLVPGQTEQFAKVSNVLQNKCVDCHAPGMMRGTLYSDLPYAKQLIKQDIDAARERLVLTEQHLSGEKAFTPLMLARIEHVISQDAMPPMPYQLMHWTSGIAENEKALLLDWVKQQRVTAVWSQDNAAEFKAEPPSLAAVEC
jgi:cytochrome c peroxidase